MRTPTIAFKTFVYGTGLLLFFARLALRARRFDAGFGWALPSSAATPSAVLQVLGGIPGLACICFFVPGGRGAPAPFDSPEEFVAIGPYKYSRNLMYISGLFLLDGLELWARSLKSC